MALDNLISISFTDEELTALDNHLNGIRSIFSGKTVNLTPDQRRQYGRVANHNKLLIDKAKTYMEHYPQWIPNFMDKSEFDKDHTARIQLENRSNLLSELSQQLTDTKTLLDHDNYTNALSFYRMIRFLAGENEPGSKSVYEDMKVLFQKNTSIKNEEDKPPAEE